MANISNAFGTITIKAKTIEDIAKLLLLTDIHLTGVEYYTQIELDVKSVREESQLEPALECMKSFVEDQASHEEDNYIFEAPFWGAGRWVYSNNVSSFKKWIEPEDTHFTYELYNSIKDSYITVIFDYVDEEPGFRVLEKCVMEFDFKTGTVVNESVDSYNYTAKNLMELDVYDQAFQFNEDGYNDIINHLKEKDIYINVLAEGHEAEAIQVLDSLVKKEQLYDEVFTDIVDIECLLDLDLFTEELENLIGDDGDSGVNSIFNVDLSSEEL